MWSEIKEIVHLDTGNPDQEATQSSWQGKVARAYELVV
jgi:hypothetical protein